MTNKSLIQDLVKDVSKTDSLNLYKFIFPFFGFGALILVLNVVLLPTKSDLHAHALTTVFYVDNFLWLLLSIVSSVAAYNHIVPGTNSKKLDGLFSICFFGLLAYIGSRLNFSNNISSHFLQELQFYKGPCAIFITVSGALHFLLMRKIVIKGLIYSPLKFSFLFSVATGSIGALAMQLICVHESSEHILIWHYPCFFALSCLSYALFRKVK